MNGKWYYNDWFLSAMVVITFVSAAYGNYIIHGGHLVW